MSTNLEENDLIDEMMDILNLGPESDEGAVEYKRKLTDLTPEVLEKKSTQMQYRMKQGNGECMYVVGVNDDGSPCGQNSDEEDLTLEILQKIADMNDYSLRIIDKRIFDGKTVHRIHVRENNVVSCRELRIGVSGNVDGGKSSLVGTLCTGELDNGRGKTRQYAFNFKHEKETGRTSSISQQITGYDVEGNHIPLHDKMEKMTWQELTSKSAKIVTLFDLAGHEKYAHTTYKGMSANRLDYIFVVVGANMGIKVGGMTVEHIRIAMAYRIPVIFIISKIDLVEDKPEVLKKTVDDIHKLFVRGSKKKLFSINDINDVATSIENCENGIYVPLFKVSVVKNKGLDLLHEFLNLCPPRYTFDYEAPVEFEVADTFMVSGVGTVIGGFLAKGTIKVGEKYFLGPDKNEKFLETNVRTIQVKRKNVKEAPAGKYVCLGVPKVKRKDVKSGMVMFKKEPMAAKTFRAEIIVRENHHTTIKVGYCPLLILHSYRSTVKIVEIEKKEDINLRKSKEVIPRGKKVYVKFQVVHRPCFLSMDDRIVLVEGTLRIVGRVTGINV
jgi:elongation factor 1-alpha